MPTRIDFKDRDNNSSIAAAIIPMTLPEYRGMFLVNVYNLDQNKHEPCVLKTFNSYESAEAYLFRYFPQMFKDDE